MVSSTDDWSKPKESNWSKVMNIILVHGLPLKYRGIGAKELALKILGEPDFSSKLAPEETVFLKSLFQ